MFKGESFCITALFIRLIFLYFATMTYVHLTLAFLTNPGYLPQWLKHPLDHNNKAPEALLRIYNLRLWMANKIHTFEEFLEPDDEESSIQRIEEEIPNTNRSNMST